MLLLWFFFFCLANGFRKQRFRPRRDQSYGELNVSLRTATRELPAFLLLLIRSGHGIGITTPHVSTVRAQRLVDPSLQLGLADNANESDDGSSFFFGYPQLHLNYDDHWKPQPHDKTINKTVDDAWNEAWKSLNKERASKTLPSPTIRLLSNEPPLAPALFPSDKEDERGTYPLFSLRLLSPLKYDELIERYGKFAHFYMREKDLYTGAKKSLMLKMFYDCICKIDWMKAKSFMVNDPEEDPCAKRNNYPQYYAYELLGGKDKKSETSALAVVCLQVECHDNLIPCPTIEDMIPCPKYLLDADAGESKMNMMRTLLESYLQFS